MMKDTDGKEYEVVLTNRTDWVYKWDTHGF